MGEIIFYCGVGLLGVAIIMLIVFACRKLRYDASRAADVKDAELEVTIPDSGETVKLKREPKPIKVSVQGVNYEDGTESEKDAPEAEPDDKANKKKSKKEQRKTVKKHELAENDAQETLKPETEDDKTLPEPEPANAEDPAETEPEDSASEAGIEIGDITDRDMKAAEAAGAEEKAAAGTDKEASQDEAEVADEKAETNEAATDVIDVQQEMPELEEIPELDELLPDDDDTNGSPDSDFTEGVVSE